MICLWFALLGVLAYLGLGFLPWISFKESQGIFSSQWIDYTMWQEAFKFFTDSSLVRSLLWLNIILLAVIVILIVIQLLIGKLKRFMAWLMFTLTLITLLPFVLQYINNLVVGRQDVALGFWFTGGSLVFLLAVSALCRIIANIQLNKRLKAS